MNRELARARVMAEVVLVERLLAKAVAVAELESSDPELIAEAIAVAHRHLLDALALQAEYGQT